MVNAAINVCGLNFFIAQIKSEALESQDPIQLPIGISRAGKKSLAPNKVEYMFCVMSCNTAVNRESTSRAADMSTLIT